MLTVGTLLQLLQQRPYEFAAALAAILIGSYILLAVTLPGDGIPGKLGLPLINDDLFYFLKTGVSNLAVAARERKKQYGDVYQSRFLMVRYLWIGGLDNIKRLLSGEHTIVESDFPESTKKMFGSHSIIVVKGKTHTALRKPLTHLFSAGAIRGYLPGLQRIIQERLSDWAARDSVQVVPEIKALTLEVLMQLVLGAPSQEAFQGSGVADPFQLWRTYVTGLFSIPINLPFTPFNRALKARQVLLQVVEGVITSKMQQLGSGSEGDKAAEVAGGRPPLSMVELMVKMVDDEGRPLEMSHMKDLTLTMMFAGHDTTASTMMVLLKELPRVPEVVEKLREEQRRVVEEHGEAITEAALKAMAYAEVTVREALRHTPIVGAVAREALQDFEMGGYRIRKGSKMWVNLRTILDDAKWADVEAGPLAPSAFNPDRWLDDSGANSRIGWLGFGAGARMCLGYPLAVAELKVFLALLARQYTWQLQDPQEPWSYFPFPVPTKGMPITMSAL